MGVRKMILIDRWLGIPFCLALTCLRSLLTRPLRGAAPVRRILFIKLAEQGSTVLAYAALREAVRRVGRENVFMLVFDNNRFILDALGVIPPENVVPLRHHNLPALIWAALGAVVRLRKLRIDAAIDLEFFARSSALLAVLSGAPARVGFHAYFGEGPYRGDLMTHRVRYNPHLHTTAAFGMLVHALDQPPDAFPRFDYQPETSESALPMFQAEAAEVAGVRRLLVTRTNQPADHLPPLILLNANASDLIPLRRWSSEGYVELATRLLDEFPEAAIAFTGAPEEAAKAEALARQVDSTQCFSLAGETTLRELLVLYTLADVLVTNDSGPAHFAALTPVRTVTLFGPETPLLFAALTPRNTPLWAGLACSPCVSALNNRQSACRNNVCMARITVSQVFDAVCASYRVQQKIRSAELSGGAVRASRMQAAIS